MKVNLRLSEHPLLIAIWKNSGDEGRCLIDLIVNRVVTDYLSQDGASELLEGLVESFYVKDALVIKKTFDKPVDMRQPEDIMRKKPQVGVDQTVVKSILNGAIESAIKKERSDNDGNGLGANNSSGRGVDLDVLWERS